MVRSGPRSSSGANCSVQLHQDDDADDHDDNDDEDDHDDNDDEENVGDDDDFHQLSNQQIWYKMKSGKEVPVLQ